MTCMGAVFWVSVGMVAYAYAGYPLVLALLARLRAAPVRKAPVQPPLTLIVSAYNEEKVIREKIENALGLDYPAEALEILVVSDASSDRTEAIAGTYAGRGVRTIRVEGRVGKSACINRVVPDARGEIIVFTDANARFERSALRRLAENFADAGIGFVTGYTRYASAVEDTVQESVSVYASLERRTKGLESRIGSCVGADGAIFAVRKGLFRPLRDTDINDLVIPLRVIEQGHRGVLEEEACCFEETAGGQKGEHARQVRITNRTLRAIFRHANLLNPARYGLFAWQLFSHKLMKLSVPFWMGLVLVANGVLAFSHPFYGATLALQGVLYGLAVVGGRASGPGLLVRVAGICNTFVVVNLAIARGWVSYLRGREFRTWDKAR